MVKIGNLGTIKKAQEKAQRKAQQAAQIAREKAEQERLEKQTQEITHRVARQVLGRLRIVDVYNSNPKFRVAPVIQSYEGKLSLTNSEWAPWSKSFIA